MRIGPDDVRALASLARLDLSPAVEARFVDELRQILGYVELLGKLDPGASETLEAEVFLTEEDDLPQPSLLREEALANAPEHAGGFFVVPRLQRGVSRRLSNDATGSRVGIAREPKGGWKSCRGVREIANGVRQGELSALEVFEEHLERSLALEPDLGVYLELFATAGRSRAAEIDRRRQRGERLGALAGVPVAVKDNIQIAGCHTTCGSWLLEGYRAPFSATAVERLLAADAVLLGRTNLDEFGMGSSCEHSAFGPTHNPWQPDRVPGGSSGGSAAGVASGGTPLALGSDTGGSVRQPAAFCGVVGLKPTWGRVSRWGLVAFASSTDQVGPLTRDVGDAAVAFTALAGSDRRDSTCTTRPVDLDLESLEEGAGGLRVGVPRELLEGPLEPRGPVAEMWRESLATVERCGARLDEVSIPHLRAGVACYSVLAASEASSNLARFDGVRYGRRVLGASFSDLVARSRGAGFGDEVKRRILLGTFALSAGDRDAYYGRAQRVRRELRRQLLDALAAVDLVVLPTTPSSAFRLGEHVRDPLAMYLTDAYTAPASLAGLPALALPIGSDPEGLPLSLQILARPFAEADALRLGRAIEHQIGWSVEPAYRENL